MNEVVCSIPNFQTSRDMAHWVTMSRNSFGPEVLYYANLALIDTFGCIVAGAYDEATSAARHLAFNTSSGKCTAVSLSHRVSAEYAALVNGVAAHALDYDDNFIPATTHASAVLVPALLAVTEEIDCTIVELLKAYIVGLEVQAWLGQLMNPEHYSRGWHGTATIGAVGAAAACAKLGGADEDTVLNAVSLATSMASGSKKQFGSMAKPLHAGLAARAGVLSYKLAMAGFEGNPEPILGKWGFLELFGCEDALPTSKNFSELAIMRYGLAQKRFPCCASAHRSLDSLQKLKEEFCFDASELISITAELPKSNADNLRFARPETVEEARFSLHYCLAVLLHSGSLSLSDLTDAAIKRSHLHDTMEKIEMVSVDQVETGNIWGVPAKIRVVLTEGREFFDTCYAPVGTIENPMPHNQLHEKVAECVATAFSQAEVLEIMETLTEWDKGEKVERFMKWLRRINHRHPHA